MNKAAVAGAVLVGLSACVGGAAAWSGSAVTGRLAQQSHDLIKLFPTFKIVKEQKSSGLFHSSYDVTFQLGCLPALPGAALGAPVAARAPEGALRPSDKPTPIELGFHHEVAHGPVPRGRRLGVADVDSTLVLPAAWQSQLKKLIGDQQLLQAHTELDLAGNYVSDFRLPSLSVSEPGQGSLQLKAITGRARGKGATTAGSVPFSAEIPTVELTSEALGQSFVLKMSGYRVEGEVSHDPASVYWFGDSQSSGKVDAVTLDGAIPSLDGSPAKPLHVRFDNLTFSSSSKLDKGLWSTASKISAKGKVNDTSIDKLEMQASMRRIHALAYQRMVQSLLSNMLSCDPVVQANASLALLRSMPSQAVQLLKHDPEYALDKLAVELSGKRAELSYSVGSKGVTDADLALASPEALTQKAVLRAAAKVDIALIERAIAALSEIAPTPTAQGQAPAGMPAVPALPSLDVLRATIDQFVQLGFLVREDESISVSAGMERGQLLVNGKPIQLPTFELPSSP